MEKHSTRTCAPRNVDIKSSAGKLASVLCMAGEPHKGRVFLLPLFIDRHPGCAYFKDIYGNGLYMDACMSEIVEKHLPRMYNTKTILRLIQK